MCIGRRVALSLPGGTLAANREYVTKACTDILYAYRKFCAASSSAVQLILPEALKLLPLYGLSMLKSHGLQVGLGAGVCWGHKEVAARG